MAGVATINLSLSVSGLGKASYTLPVSFTGTVPTVVAQGYRLLAAGASEALPLGDVAAVEGVLIFAAVCDDGAIEVDTSFDSAFNAELTMAEGEAQYFKIADDAKPIHVKNADDAAGAYGFLVFGTA
ncbi:hypothetical protein ES703_24428 [subsurface metagenome]